MGLTVTLKGKPLAETAFSDAGLMREIGLVMRDRIQTRTKSGRDADGRPFQAYTTKYEERKRKALGTAAPVNLEVSGRMLQALVLTEVTPNTVEIGYKD